MFISISCAFFGLLWQKSQKSLWCMEKAYKYSNLLQECFWCCSIEVYLLIACWILEQNLSVRSMVVIYPPNFNFARIFISSPPKKSVISQGHTFHSFPKVGNIYWSLCEWERYFVFLNIFSSMVFCSHDQNNQGITLITKQAKACHLFQSKQYFVCVIMLTQYCFLLSW